MKAYARVFAVYACFFGFISGLFVLLNALSGIVQAFGLRNAFSPSIRAFCAGFGYGVGAVCFLAFCTYFFNTFRLDLDKDEVVLKSAPASHPGRIMLLPLAHPPMLPDRAMGRLILTNKRLAFRVFDTSSGRCRHNQSWSLDQVSCLETCTSLLFLPLPNGLVVRMRDGSYDKFFLLDRDDWLDAIKNASLITPGT